MASIIKTDSLTVRYGPRIALNELSLDLPPGIVGLLGPNGAGKSTLIKTLLGFLTPASGSAEVFSQPVSGGVRELRQRLGYFPERSVLVPGLSSIDTVALAGELGGLPQRAALERAHEVLWFAGLGEARYRLVEGFSTGMLQRNKLAMAMVHDPELLLLDEPTSGMDPIGRRQMLELIGEVKKRGMSVLLSTHLLHDVEQVCDHVAVLEKGRLAMAGSLSELRQEPGWVYEIRVREERTGAFKRAIETLVEDLSEDRDGLLRITLAAPDTRKLFQIARETGSEIRHLRRFETSLEERFLDAVSREPVETS